MALRLKPPLRDFGLSQAQGALDFSLLSVPSECPALRVASPRAQDWPQHSAITTKADMNGYPPGALLASAPQERKQRS